MPRGPDPSGLTRRTPCRRYSAASLETMLGTERAYDAAAIVAAVHSECHNFGNELTRMMANVSATLLRANSPVPKDPSECSRIEREVLLLQAL